MLSTTFSVPWSDLLVFLSSAELDTGHKGKVSERPTSGRMKGISYQTGKWAPKRIESARPLDLEWNVIRRVREGDEGYY
jgi:hypothetical protein